MSLRRKTQRLDPVELTEKADQALEQLRAQQPQVNAITKYLERRKNINGFGIDFEWSLVPKGGR